MRAVLNQRGGPYSIIGDFTVEVIEVREALIHDRSVRTADAGPTCFVKSTNGQVSSSTIDFAIMSAAMIHAPWTRSTASTSLATHRPCVIDFKGSLSDRLLLTMPKAGRPNATKVIGPMCEPIVKWDIWQAQFEAFAKQHNCFSSKGHVGQFMKCNEFLEDIEPPWEGWRCIAQEEVCVQMLVYKPLGRWGQRSYSNTKHPPS
jgi:hypothetical protein